MHLVRQFTLMDVPTINKYHSVMNIGEHFVLIDQVSLIPTYIYHCNILYDHKFDDYCESGL